MEIEVEGQIVKKVLNLVINGIPSILKACNSGFMESPGFKPCYKWNTFNTLKDMWFTGLNKVF